MFQYCAEQISTSPFISVGVAAAVGAFLQRFTGLLNPILSFVTVLMSDKNKEFREGVLKTLDSLEKRNGQVLQNLLDALKDLKVQKAV